MDQKNKRALAATARVLTAYLHGQRVQAAALPQIIRDVRGAFDGKAAIVTPPRAATPASAADPRALVRRYTVLCADCGWGGKSLKRHLAARHGLTPDAYRARWGLPSDHPLVSPELSARRSAMARAGGLGRLRA